jgi:hypothetical protein
VPYRRDILTRAETASRQVCKPAWASRQGSQDRSSCRRAATHARLAKVWPLDTFRPGA